MQWTWFRKDRLGIGFTLGILFILLGIYSFILYVNAAGQRGAEIMVFTGSIAIIGGLVNNVVVIIYWLERKKERKIAQAFHSKQKIYPTIICPSCKKKISEDYSQCPWCGTELKLHEDEISDTHK